MRLEIGVGRYAQSRKDDGWITIDARPECKADYIATVPPLPKEIKKMGAVFEIIQALHFWEHLYHWQAIQLANEVYKILKPGGMLVLELPNLRHCCEILAGIRPLPYKPDAPWQPDPRYTIWGIYGAQTDPTWKGSIEQAHKWGYTPETLMEQLKMVGFSKIEMRAPSMGLPERDMRLEAIK